ncbi:hypothetical protein ACN47E_004850 [Coniothyrium glycines]
MTARREESEFLFRQLDTKEKSIRLLQVLPGSDDQVITCELRHVRLNERPEYIALSYTWDHDNAEQSANLEESTKPEPHPLYGPIYFQGVPMAVGRNLWTFLWHYRKAINAGRQSRELWVDAICINQGDTKERNHQVTHMRDIYSAAISVIVWLGPVYDGAEWVFQLLAEPSRSPPSPESSGTRSRSKLLSYQEQLTAVVGVLHREYWSRIWVVQEFLLAAHVEIWCGPFLVELPRLHDLPILLQKQLPRASQKGNVFCSPGWRLVKDRQDFWRHHDLPRRTLHELVGKYKHSKATDIRDKLYALFGLANVAAALRVDYSKTAVEILEDLIRSDCNNNLKSLDHYMYQKAISFATCLEVQPSQLYLHLLRNAPDLQHRLHRLVSNTYVVAHLAHVSPVVRARSLTCTIERFSAKRRNVSPLQQLGHLPEATVFAQKAHFKTSRDFDVQYDNSWSWYMSQDAILSEAASAGAEANCFRNAEHEAGARARDPIFLFKGISFVGLSTNEVLVGDEVYFYSKATWPQAGVIVRKTSDGRSHLVGTATITTRYYANVKSVLHQLFLVGLGYDEGISDLIISEVGDGIGEYTQRAGGYINYHRTEEQRAQSLDMIMHPSVVPDMIAREVVPPNCSFKIYGGKNDTWLSAWRRNSMDKTHNFNWELWRERAIEEMEDDSRKK